MKQASNVQDQVANDPNPNRRDLEDDGELLRRAFYAELEELFVREYDDFLVERDDFDDLN